MSEIIINPQKIKQETGYYIFEDFLFPRLQLSSWKMHGPFMLKANGMRYMFGRMHEKGYWQGKVLPLDLSPRYFTPYFLFAPDETVVYKNAVAGIEAMLPPGDAVELEYDAPVALYNLLKEKFPVVLKKNPATFTGSVYQKKTDQVESELNFLRAELTAVADKLVDELATDKKDVLRKYLQKDGRGRYKLLDRYLEELGASAIVATSGLNVQETGGMPQKHYMDGCIVIYTKGSGDLQLVMTNEYGLLRNGRGGILSVQGTPVILPSGKIAIDEEHMGMGIYLGLGLEKREIVYASTALRDWREEWAGNDLAGYIIAGLAVRRGLTRSMDEAQHRISGGIAIYEQDIYDIHLETIDRFLNQYGAPLVFEVYFANLHSGNRFESPSCYKPGYRITPLCNTVKFDTGIRLYDQWGYLRGVSDIARTICFTDEAVKVYDIFEKIMLQTGIPAAQVGKTGTDVYMAACDAINEHFDYLKSIELLPKHIETLQQVYSRDVGHLMGKEEAANHCFKNGEKRCFKPGMIGCFEIQWGYNRHSFGTEDSFLTTEEGPVVFTR